MRYLILIYANEQQFQSITPEGIATMQNDYGQYMADLVSSGVHKGGEQLQPSFTATTIRVRDGKTQNTDGPFAETKEQLGGYFVIEADTIDEAISWAAKCPGAKHGTVELRPIVAQPMSRDIAEKIAAAAR
ncbi:MAG: YciI family protein [Gemmatimonadaceae bacterium]